VRLTSFIFSGAILLAGLDVNQALSIPSSEGRPRQYNEPGTPLQLKSRRRPDYVEILIEGAGAQAQLRGAPSQRGWSGELRPSQPSLLPNGPQVLTLQDGGLRSISLEGVGQSFRISIDTGSSSTPISPVVSNDGINLILRIHSPATSASKNARLDITQPGWIPQESYTPSFRPRAVAPPVGDMAVGSMVLRNRSYVQLSGPPITITARGADARDLLMALAQMGGYGFAFSSDSEPTGSNGSMSSSGSAGKSESGGKQGITVSFRNESFARAFNFVLLSAGLQAKVEDRMILVGKNVLAKSIGAQMSKVFRLNQVSASGAADYLANLGAQISKTSTITITSNEGNATSTGGANNSAGNVSSAGSTASQITSKTASSPVVESYGASTGPLLGLSGVTDDRLGTITLVGDASTIAIAENYLRQLDLRKRQVAIEIKILDINLTSNTLIDNSVYYKSPNGSWFISDSGKGLYQTPGLKDIVATTANNTYLERLNARIESANSKVLANPTLLIQEGSNAKVEAVTSFVTNASQAQTVANNTICNYTRENAGLVVPINIEKIDDNGFVSLKMKPEIAVAERAGEAQCAGPVTIYNIVKRQLDSGMIRLRDNQTLVLTGIIQDRQVAAATKIPIMGDLPLIGQYFRSSTNDRSKSELVILATPRIIRDEDGGSYGYGIRTSTIPN